MRALTCWLSLALSALCLADPEAFLTRPDIHGNQVVFTAEGDLWLTDLASGVTRRLTSDPGVESNAHFSPDGSQIAFTAHYDGGADVYVMPATGGSPKRLTFDPMSALVLGWTPDGKNVLFRSGSKIYAPAVEQFATQEIFSVPVDGGMPTKLPVPRGSYAALNADGKSLAYVPTSNEWMNWFRYQAGEADKIWLADLSSGKFTKLTDSPGVDTQPTWAGDTIYFVSERSGVRNLYSLDPLSKKVKQLTFSTDRPVRYPSSDGKKVVFEIGPNLEVFDPATGTAKIVNVQLNSDRIHSRPYEAPIAGSRLQGLSVGPTGKRVALVSRGHLVTVPATEGTMRTLVSDSAQRVQGPAWSPDGKQIAYVSDASGEEQLYLADAQNGSAPKQLTKDLTGEHGTPLWAPDGKHLLLGNRDNTIQLIDATTGAVTTVIHSQGPSSYDDVQSDFTFSPDGKWVAYAVSPEGETSNVFLYNIATAKSTLVTDPVIISSSPAFSPDGKFLYVVQGREFSEKFHIGDRISHDVQSKITAFALAADTTSPFDAKDQEEGETPKKPEEPAKETKIDLDGLSGRLIDMKVPAGDYTSLLAVPGRLLIQSGPTILAFDIAAKSLTPLANGVQMVELSHDGHKLLVSNGLSAQLIDAAGGPTPPGAGAIKLTGLTVTVDPVAEWRQIFNETWRVGRDFFYDPNMHGVNWKAIKAKYEAELPMVGNRADLTRIQGDMISELNTGHCYVGGPSPFPAKPARPGLLGVDLMWDGTANAYKIKHILKGSNWSPETRSPLADPGLGVHEGDYLLRINGTTLTHGKDPAASLVGTAGLTISVTVNSKPTEVGAKTLPVVPIATEEALRLQEWVQSRRDYVTKASGGQIAYVYVPDMEDSGANEFAKAYYPNVDKPGIIVDVRGNGGGNISGNLLDDLSSPIDGFFSFRSGGVFRRAGWAPLGHVAAITNEFAFSDGEYFSEFFKRLKIGPLVGHRTGGGEVGSGGGYALVDGGTVYIPNYGAWVPGEWVVEGRGAVPDYEVDQDPAQVMAGKDPQLDKTIELLLEEIKKHPVTRPQHPPFPVKLGGSRG